MTPAETDKIFELKADNDLGTILSYEIGIKNGFACSRKYRVKISQSAGVM